MRNKGGEKKRTAVTVTVTVGLVLATLLGMAAARDESAKSAMGATRKYMLKRGGCLVGRLEVLDEVVRLEKSRILAGFYSDLLNAMTPTRLESLRP